MTRASGSFSNYLRRRLGSGGRSRLRIIERVRELTPEVRGVDGPSLGLSDAQLRGLSAYYELPLAAERLVWRGDAERLKMIAWWGSAVADIAVAANERDRSGILWEAGAFNLAVALFDSAIENIPDAAALLAEALDPERTRARLSNPDDGRCSLECSDVRIEIVTRLFDSVLASAGRRLASRAPRLTRLSELLEGMYLSELGLSGDPFLAKSGPVIFIGALASEPCDAKLRTLFEALGHFCHVWDDWQDVEEDMRCVAPNFLLGSPGRRASFGRIAYLARGAMRIVAGDRLHESLACIIANALRNTLAAAGECDPGVYSRTLSLCRELMN